MLGPWDLLRNLVRKLSEGKNVTVKTPASSPPSSSHPHPSETCPKLLCFFSEPETLSSSPPRAPPPSPARRPLTISATWPPPSRTPEITLRNGAGVGGDGDSRYRGSVAADTRPSFSPTFWEQPEKEEKVLKASTLGGSGGLPRPGGREGPEVGEAAELFQSHFFTSWQLQAQHVCLGGRGMSLIAQAVAVRGKQK